MTLRRRFESILPLLAVLGSVTALGIGTSFAKHLFPLIGSMGTTALRVGFSALLLLLIWRPWRWPLSRADARSIVRYGVALGFMNLLFYMALRTIPFGLAVAIEFAGPLSVSLYSSRKPIDFVWLLLALIALGLTDSHRMFKQPPKSFSWWDYRDAGFRRNRGLRIDHILVSNALKDQVKSCVIDKTPRKNERPSDHAPVVVEVN